MKRVIVTADLGHFKAYRVTEEEGESPRVELIRSYDLPEARQRSSEKLSDSAGRFKRAGRPTEGGRAGYGERHNMQSEAQRRIIRQTAQSINMTVQAEDCGKWYLASSKSINKGIVEALDPAVRSRLRLNLRNNLTGIKKSEILGYFE